MVKVVFRSYTGELMKNKF